ncbi:MAG: deoxyribonuclease V [bacterium]
MNNLVNRFRNYYPKNVKEAKDIQNELSTLVQLKPFNNNIKIIGGIDTSYKKNNVLSAICIMNIISGEVIEKNIGIFKKGFPYVPTYLAFREVPAIIKAIDTLKHIPDIFLIDGHGICHPRRVGIASHIGVVLGIPTVGVAKSHLIGDFNEPGSDKGMYSPIKINDDIVGFVFRSRTGVKPIFISPGHLIDLESTLKIVEKSLNKYRIPEPLRCAHIFAQKMKMEV